jgi:hypothetical protein
VIGIAQQKVAERFEPDRRKGEDWDMLGSLSHHGLTQEEAESESVLQMFVEPKFFTYGKHRLVSAEESLIDRQFTRLAGSDTTATAIRSTFLHLITHPTVLRKLYAEIDTAVTDGRISSSPISDIDARRLPYLQACIKEGLRIWPPVTGLMEKVVPRQGDTINDVFIPGGTKIGQVVMKFHLAPLHVNLQNYGSPQLAAHEMTDLMMFN